MEKSSLDEGATTVEIASMEARMDQAEARVSLLIDEEQASPSDAPHVLPEVESPEGLVALGRLDEEAKRRPPREACEPDSYTVAVPRELLREVLVDGCCPLHLRLQIKRALLGDDATDVEGEAASASSGSPPIEQHADTEVDKTSLADLDRPCLSSVVAYLPFAEVLTVRSCSREPLQWAMQRSASEEDGPQHLVHDRIRTRLWMRRIMDLTHGTQDESVFETRLRNLADEALRSRMEKEMQEALGQMEEHIQRFQAEVDRRLAEQEQHVRRLVEERVQQELDTILASEVVKVQAMVEDRVRERVNAVSAVFRREVRETVRELQARLDALAEENDLLRDAFAEANMRAKMMFWAQYPPPALSAAAACVGLQNSSLFSLRRRLAIASAT